VGHVRADKLPLRVEIGHGAGGFGSQMVYNNFIFWGMIFSLTMLDLILHLPGLLFP
jgi:hypothetical protein